MKEVIKSIKSGEVVAIPTDTIYGIACDAFDERAVEKIYKIKNRQKNKPLGVLIGSIDDLKLFFVEVNEKTKEILDKYWPGPVSIILPCDPDKFQHIHRGANSISFRLGDKKWFRDFLQKTGPLTASSVNPEGEPFAESIKEAKDYFGDNIDVYWDNGKLGNLPSTLIKVENGQVQVLREGTVKV